MTAEYLDTETVESLKLLSDDDPTFWQSLLESFLSQSVELEREMTLAADQSDKEAVLRILHKLKGSAGNVGAMILVQKIQAFEQEIKNKGLKLPSDAGLAVIQTLNHTRLAIKQALQQAHT